MVEDDRFQKFVSFDVYCKECIHKDKPETDDPCNECLQVPARTDHSHRPINFKRKKT